MLLCDVVREWSGVECPCGYYQAVDAKKRADQEAKIRLKKAQDQIAADKERRRKEAEDEKARIAAAKAAQGQP